MNGFNSPTCKLCLINVTYMFYLASGKNCLDFQIVLWLSTRRKSQYRPWYGAKHFSTSKTL